MSAINRLQGRAEQQEFPSLAPYFEMVIFIISLCVLIVFIQRVAHLQAEHPAFHFHDVCLFLSSHLLLSPFITDAFVVACSPIVCAL